MHYASIIIIIYLNRHIFNDIKNYLQVQTFTMNKTNSSNDNACMLFCIKNLHQSNININMTIKLGENSSYCMLTHPSSVSYCYCMLTHPSSVSYCYCMLTHPSSVSYCYCMLTHPSSVSYCYCMLTHPSSVSYCRHSDLRVCYVRHSS